MTGLVTLLSLMLAAPVGAAPRATAEKPRIRAIMKPARPSLAQAAQTASCSVVEIWASNDGGGVDPKLERWKSKLSGLKWTSFKHRGETSLTVEMKKPASAGLSNGGKVTLLYKDRRGDAAKPRLYMNVGVLDKGGTQIADLTTNFDSGDAVLISGEPEEKGVYMLGLSCTAK
jgi:hypothetical protein